MTKSNENKPLPLGRSVDMVRVIRRSMRCLTFGLIGLVPLFGTGFAYQALRLRRGVSADLADGWTPPPVYYYWLLGTAAMVLGWNLLTVAEDFTLCMVLLALQSWHCWRRSGVPAITIWNPAGRELLWGVVFAYAGLGFSLWAVVVLVLQVAKAITPV